MALKSASPIGPTKEALRARLRGEAVAEVVADLRRSGNEEAAKHLESLLNESIDVINSHPRVVAGPGTFRPTPGDSGA